MTDRMQLDNEQFRQCWTSAKQETETLEKEWNWVETTVWTDRMLAALENGVKGGKWYSLFDKVCARVTLDRFWQKVARAQLNPNLWDSTRRWMKVDIVTQWVTAHSDKLCTFLQGLPWH